MIDLQPHIQSIKFIINLNYYKFFYPYKPNHYNLINKLREFKCIYLNYKTKYPSCGSWSNLNEQLFKENPSSKEEFYSGADEQKHVKKQIVSDIKFICDKDKNKDCDICSEQFQNLYIKNDYHIDQNIDALIYRIKKDVIKKM